MLAYNKTGFSVWVILWVLLGSFTAQAAVPIISEGGTSTVTINEYASYGFTVPSTDSDIGDSAGVEDSLGFNLIVTNTSDAPSITSTAILVATEDVIYRYTRMASDIDVEQGFTVLVTAVNDSPAINGTSDTVNNEGSFYSFIPSASDPDIGNTLIFSITNQPGWASFYTVTGTLSGTPLAVDTGITTGIVSGVSGGIETVNARGLFSRINTDQ